jgi:hypothetical protein
MLRLLESQLREELEALQTAFEHASQRSAEEAKTKRLTKIMRAKLRNVHLDLDTICSQPSCPICSEDFPVDSQALRLPCSHLFHKDCVMPWLEMKQTCPICRNELSDAIPSANEMQKLTEEELRERLVDAGATEEEAKTSMR